MNCAHQTLHNAELIMNDLCKGRQAVGCAGRIGNLTSDRVRFDYMRLVNTYHSVFGVVRVKIDAYHKHRGICGGRRDDYLLGTTLQVSRRPDRTILLVKFPGITRTPYLSTVVKTPEDSIT